MPERGCRSCTQTALPARVQRSCLHENRVFNPLGRRSIRAEPMAECGHASSTIWEQPSRSA
eukprot:5893564-Lingulodinium_polyedra.AAC.1